MGAEGGVSRDPGHAVGAKVFVHFDTVIKILI